MASITRKIRIWVAALTGGEVPESGRLVVDSTTRRLYVGDGTSIEDQNTDQQYYTRWRDIRQYVSGQVSTINSAIDLKAPLASPALTGLPTAPTPPPPANNTLLATTAFVKTAIDALVDGAPGALDTLNEIAAALQDDEDALSALTIAVASKVPQARLVNGHALTADIIVSKGDVGLGNVDNTSDANKPVSIAQGAADAAILAALNAFIATQPINIYKGSDTNRSDNTLTPDPALEFPIAAGQLVSFSMTVFIRASSGGDFKSRVTGPSDAVNVLLAQAVAHAGTTNNRVASAFDTSDLIQLHTSTNNIRFIVNGTVLNGPTAGMVRFEWAQNTTNGAATSVLAGSTLNYKIIT